MATNPTTPDPQPPKKRKKKATAFADLLHDWESLLGAVADNPSLAPVEAHRAALAETLDKAKQAKGVQESHRASKQSTTQSLKELVVVGKDLAIRLRGAIRAELGPTTEQLTQFGIHPLRRRPPRHKQQSGTPTPAPAPQPETPATKGKP